ncbi:MAG: hypothetical protein ACD_66C00268G0005, partial [uncultured bacterium]
MIDGGNVVSAWYPDHPRGMVALPVRGLKPTALSPRPIWDVCRERCILQLSTITLSKTQSSKKTETPGLQELFLRTIIFEENNFKSFSNETQTGG